MKKVLFASTALVLTAGVASAEITLSGSGHMGVMYDGTDVVVKHGVSLSFSGSGETDGGLSFGGSHGIADGCAFDGDFSVFIATNGLTLTTGNDVDNAADVGGLADVGYDGLGVDNVAEGATLGAADVNISYAFGDVTAAASISDSGDDWAIGVSASFDAITVALGLDDDNGSTTVVVGAGYSAGAVSGEVYYASNDDADDTYGVEVSYTSGDVTVTGVFADGGASEAYGIGVAYDLGGATLAGGVAEVAGTTVADLGISFDF